MWLIPLLFLLQTDCPPCVCEAACEGNAITCKVTTDGETSVSFDPTGLILQVEALEYQVSQLQAYGEDWARRYTALQESCHAHAIYLNRLNEWRWFAEGPGIQLVLGGRVDFDGDGDGDLRDLALAIRSPLGGER